jgi:hypothetical protein
MGRVAKYTKRVEVFPGDTLLLANGDEWVISGFRYISIEETTQVIPSGDRKVSLGLQRLKARAKRKREYPR